MFRLNLLFLVLFFIHGNLNATENFKPSKEYEFWLNELKEKIEYKIPLGRIGLRNTKILKLNGLLERILYKTPENKSTDQIIKELRSQLKKFGFEELFSFKGKEVGDDYINKYLEMNPLKNDEEAGPAFNHTDSSHNRFIVTRRSSETSDEYIIIFTTAGWWRHAVTLIDNVVVKRQLRTSQEKELTTNEQLLKNGRMILWDIHFTEGNDALLPDSQSKIKELSVLLLKNPVLKVAIVAHIDDSMNEQICLKLTQIQAKIVMEKLSKDHGIEKHRLSYFGAGSYCPIATNETIEGRKENCRLEIIKRNLTKLDKMRLQKTRRLEQLKRRKELMKKKKRMLKLKKR
ncbi:OmpA family protein [Candidatus Riflebacteria bacterium]